ncbi:MAG: PAS domain S-box protein, partial [Planctomycetes bacterium]|nr:PAS domain S-box protein [Planctomycetota bacterium]
MRRRLESQLEGRGFVVDVCADASRAVSEATAEIRAVIVVDVSLFGEDSVRVVERLRAHPSTEQSVILVWTETDRIGHGEALIEAGIDDYLAPSQGESEWSARLRMAERRSIQREARAIRATDAEFDFGALANTIPVMLWVASPDGEAQSFSRCYLDYTGRSEEQERGFGWSEAVHSEDYSRCLDSYFSAVRRREPFEIEYRLRRPDGSYSWVCATGVPRRDSSGNRGFVVSCLDVQARHTQESEQRSSDERLRVVLRNLPVPVIAFDERGRISVWNRECERLLGYRAERLVGEPYPLDLLVPEELDRRGLWDEWASPREPYYGREIAFADATGRARTIAWSNLSSELRVPGWSNWVIGVDQTTRVESEARSAALETRLRESQKLAESRDLIDFVTHDLKGLLTVVLAEAALLRSDLPGDHPSRNAASRVVDGARAAADLSVQLFSYVTGAPVVSESVDLSELLGQQRLLLEAVARSRPLAFAFDDGLRRVSINPTQCVRVALNLVANASDALGDRAGTIRLATRRATPEESE